MAYQAEFKSDPKGDQPNSYRLVWEVESYSPIDTYELQYREHNVRDLPHPPAMDAWMTVSVLSMPSFGNGQETENLPWTTITIPANESSSLQQWKAYTIEDLTEATTYEAKVRAKNRFGWNRESEIFSFATLGGYGMHVPVSKMEAALNAPYYDFLIVIPVVNSILHITVALSCKPLLSARPAIIIKSQSEV